MEPHLTPQKPFTSASQLGRSVACAASVRLPQWPAFPIIPAVGGGIGPAERGTQIHKFLEVLAKTLDLGAALEAVADEDVRAECEQIDLEPLYFGASDRETITELSVALDIVTGAARVLPPPLPGERYAPVSRTEIPGTIDLVQLLEDGTALVRDYKTGARAGNAWQLRFAVLAVEQIYGVQAQADFLYLDKDWLTWRSSGPIEQANKAQWMDELRAAYAAWTRSGPTRDSDVVTGPHCAYCPAVESCPAYMRSIKEAAQAVDMRDFLSGLGDPAKAYHHGKKMIEDGYRLVNRVEKLAEIVPIDIGNGLELKPVDSIGNEKVVNTVAALECLQSVVGTDTYNKIARSDDVTKTSLKAAIKQARAEGAIKMKGAEANEMLEAKLRLTGAVERKTKREVQVVTKGAK